MARAAKKKVELSLEEKLAQALVPEEEQPYQVPGNWCWIKGKSFLSPMENKRPFGEYFNYVDIDSIDNKRQVVNAPKHVEVSKAPSRASRALHVGDTVFSMVRPYLKNIAFIDDSIADSIASTGFYVCTPKRNVLPKYLYYVMISSYVVDGLNAYMKGDNSPSIRKEELEQFPYPIPPIPEQQRIVDRIESLFAKLDEAKEKAQAVVDGFEDRKAAILHKAFTGELTAEWRKENRVALESWEMKSIDSICHSLKYGTAKKSEKTGTVVVIRMGNLQQGEIDWTDLAYTTDKDDIEKYQLEPNDVLFNRTNSAALVGKTSIYRGEYPAVYAGYLIKLDYNHDVIVGDYLNYALNTQAAKEYCNIVKTDGVNQSNINAKKIGAYVFPVPRIEEQEKIVLLLKSLIRKEQQVKEVAEQVIDQIDTMKKSILARAFRGELGTNDPSDESAVELLKKVLNEK